MHEYTQGDYVFYIRPMDPFKALDLLGDLQKTVLPALGAALGQTSIGGEEVKQDNGGEEVKQALTLSNFMHKKLDIENALKQLSAAINGAKLNDLLTRILNAEYISYAPVGEPDKAKRLDRAVVATIYNGRLKGMFELAWEVIRVNYSDFFTT